MIILAIAMLQVHIPSHLDPATEAEQAALLDVATPYIRCINSNLPAAYFDWPRRRATDDERATRVNETVEAFRACETERTAAATANSFDDRKVGMFIARIEDSYTHPVMFGAEPRLLIDPRTTGTSNAENR